MKTYSKEEIQMKLADALVFNTEKSDLIYTGLKNGSLKINDDIIEIRYIEIMMNKKLPDAFNYFMAKYNLEIRKIISDNQNNIDGINLNNLFSEYKSIINRSGSKENILYFCVNNLKYPNINEEVQEIFNTYYEQAKFNNVPSLQFLSFTAILKGNATIDGTRISVQNFSYKESYLYNSLQQASDITKTELEKSHLFKFNNNTKFRPQRLRFAEVYTGNGSDCSESMLPQIDNQNYHEQALKKRRTNEYSSEKSFSTL